jgi:signal transduction histidine kinase
MADLTVLRKRSRLRLMSLAVFLIVSGLSVAGCLITRSVVSDQEHKLLKQRTEEAALYLSTAISSVQTELASLAASAAATNESPDAFKQSTALLTSAPGGFATVALVRVGSTPTVIASSGGGLGNGLGPVRAQAVTTAVQKVGLTGSLVGTPLFGSGTARLLGFAYASPSLPSAAIYAETQVKDTTQSPTQSQPFSELIAAVYAVPRVQADQLVVASSKSESVPLTGDTVAAKAPVGQGQPWLLVAKARHSLVGSVATWTPWVLLGAGLVAALLATGIVEALVRRREYADELVRTRTEELQKSLVDLAAAHDQLVRQERLAAIGQLASTVGHELRNPLGVISNAVYLLRGDLGPHPTQPAQRHLATAEREVSAATVIVSDLLEFAREREPAFSDVDMTTVVDEVLSILPPPTGITVAREGDTTVVARVDRDMVRQVLLNLIGNGYQAMPDGGHLTVSVTAASGTVQTKVRDDGVGMTDEVQQHLFEPFFTTKARGVGLGLAVSKRIIEAHGGTIVASSEVGAGTEFTVLLPAIGAPRAPADAAVTSEFAG